MSIHQNERQHATLLTYPIYLNSTHTHTWTQPLDTPIKTKTSITDPTTPSTKIKTLHGELDFLTNIFSKKHVIEYVTIVKIKITKNI